MNQLSVDVAVIGAGSAGLTAFRAARLHHERVVLIEQAQYGTTCARVGCMPSKLLIAAAQAAYGVRHANVFGVHAGDPRIDGAAVMRRVREERDRFVGGVVGSTEAIAPEWRLMGQARFLDPSRLQVGEDTVVNARAVVIATGSRPFIPPELQAAADRLFTSDDVFDWPTLPESVAIVGVGVIGLELGQALHRLGVRVVLFGRADTTGQLDDPALAKLATTIFSRELDLRLQTELVRSERTAQGVALTVRDRHGVETTEHFSHVLSATGRVPNVDQLDLANSGLALGDNGVPVFDPATMQCGASAIFIAGDASNERALLHEAVDQGRIAGDNAGAWPNMRPALRHVPFSIAFSEPQLTQVGPRWKQLQDADYVIGRVSFEDQGRSRVIGENHGALHVYAERSTGRLLGAQMAGPRAEHLGHLLAWALQNDMTIGQMLRMPFYHPVIEEGLRTALKDARDQMSKPPPPIEHCDDCTPGV
ncbi:MAG: dihydrolipoyl dehydrogenase [Lacisediminimonas sp.]|nr:dihydrolipoyl dehydrogenase [Lacisediminimonas sp.]